MPVLVADPARRDRVRADMLERHRVQTSVLYPAVHEFTAYASMAGRSLPRSERVARTQITLPLYPSLSERAQEHVVEALHDALARG
jgi:dTDP-4-amino-4,6-dideoxygalactose transaminase